MTEAASEINAPESTSNATVQGEQIALRDMHINYNEITPELTSIDVSKYNIPHYTPPKFTPAVINQLQSERIAIIYGGRGFDKGSFLKHLGATLLSTTDGYVVKEIRKNHEVLPILDKIEDQNSPAVILMKNTHPGLIEYDLDKVRHICDRKNHYVILSTDVSEHSWHITTTQKALYWHDVPIQALYHPESLSKNLSEHLHRISQKNTDLSIPKDLTPQTTLNSRLTVEDVAVRLETPEKIRLFTRLLSQRQEAITEGLIEDIFDLLHAQGDNIIHQWFLSLNRKEKLIAVGAALLDGMMDDQFFAAMQILVKDFWEHSEKSLLSLDYQDIEFLIGYFELDHHNGVRILKSKYPNQQAEIIQAAWKTHRRHIMSALPKLISLVYASMDANERDWEKFGNQNRRLILRGSISQTISDVGLVSPSSIDSILLELACWADGTKQRVAAKAIARWREFNRDDLLFDTIDRWLNDDTIQSDIEQFREGKRFEHRQRFGKTATEYVKATAVLSLAYASLYDSPNELSQGIIDRLIIIAADPDRRVKSSVQTAIPRLIHHHILQLKDIIAEELVKYDDLGSAIGEGIAKALEDYPAELKSTLDAWLNDSISEASAENRRQKLTYRDKVLEVWMRTYEHLNYESVDPEIISRNGILKQLSRLAKAEKREGLRQGIFEVATTLIMQDYAANSKYVSDIFDTSNNREKQYLLNRLEEEYVRERLALRGGNYKLVIENGEFSSWRPSAARPQTTVEQTMCDWLESDNEILMKLASLAYASFAEAIDSKEHMAKKVVAQPLMQTSQLILANNTTQRHQQSSQLSNNEYSLSFCNRIFIFFLYLGKPHKQKELFKSVLIFLKGHKEHSYLLWQSVLLKWKKSDRPIQKSLGSKLAFFKIGSLLPDSQKHKNRIV